MIRFFGVIVGFASLGGRDLAAQAVRCAPGTLPYFEFQVPNQAVYVRHDTTPLHPALDPHAVQRAKADSIVAQFIVDTAGRVVPETFRMLRGGTREEHRTLPLDLQKWQFRPAMFGPDCKVPQLVQTPLER